MSRDATINVSLTPKQLRLLRERVESGDYTSASEVVREGLRMLFQKNRLGVRTPPGKLRRQLEAGYRATANRDRKLAKEWERLPGAWPK